MKGKTPINVGASVRARLLRVSKERQEDFTLMLMNYAAERFTNRWLVHRALEPWRPLGGPLKVERLNCGGSSYRTFALRRKLLSVVTPGGPGTKTPLTIRPLAMPMRNARSGIPLT